MQLDGDTGPQQALRVVELVISPGSDEPTLKLLGLATLPLRVAAVRPLDQVAAALCPARPVKAAPLGEIGVILATTVDLDALPPDVRAGLGRLAPGRPPG
ncbi:hypothetical protein [Saccharopolyspora terrae]|uniref:hypothetical protein n=1 Tax=Saccharopolyspora terrae TaxID=2530384 RepID=UPI001404F9EB|nr:hypothetical protein [Saccharopolyspora terrae]